MKIGANLKRLRLLNSLTQEELANRTDLSKGFISQLENDTTCPSIATLKDILDVFGVSLQEFFSEIQTVQFTFGTDDRVRPTGNDDPVAVELLVPGAQRRRMDPALVTLRPGAVMGEQDIHGGEEFGYVLQGRIELRLNDTIFPVRKEECFFFSSDRRHSVRNVGKGMAKILWVVSPPTFDYTGR
ncbi:MAG: helix-turn-helix domain-containing protein [Desulfuromonadaceae bacterium]|nr:helix-turn-helix domain-containing protein [Desulfuromonadaceae bacterium]